MAVITLKQLLHRTSPGAAIDSSNPLEVQLYGAGNPISVATAAGQTTTQSKIDALATLIGALDASKETDPDAASAALLALQRGLMSLVAKETTLGSVKSAVESIASEDFATQTTLAQVLAALTSVKDSDGIKKIADAVTVSGLENLATAAKQDTIKDVLDTLATESTLGDVKSALTSLVGAAATESTLDDVKTAAETLAGTVADGAQKVTLTGSKVTEVRIWTAQSVNAGATAIAYVDVSDARAVSLGLNNLAFKRKVEGAWFDTSQTKRFSFSPFSVIASSTNTLDSSARIDVVSSVIRFQLTNEDGSARTFDGWVYKHTV